MSIIDSFVNQMSRLSHFFTVHRCWVESSSLLLQRRTTLVLMFAWPATQWEWERAEPLACLCSVGGRRASDSFETLVQIISPIKATLKCHMLDPSCCSLPPQPNPCWCWSQRMCRSGWASLLSSTAKLKVTLRPLCFGAGNRGLCPMAGTWFYTRTQRLHFSEIRNMSIFEMSF